MRSVGICPVLMDMLKIRALTLQDHEKRITLALDGMTLTQALEYNKNSDEVSGFVNCGKYGLSPTVANQGILLMVRGLTLKWKQIIGFFISKHNLNTSVLGQIISDAVSELKQIGFYVDGIVMDQESSQWKWVGSMRVSPDTPWVVHSQVKSFIIPDPPHLIKNLRNNFMDKDIAFTIDGVNMTTKWLYVSMKSL